MLLPAIGRLNLGKLRRQNREDLVIILRINKAYVLKRRLLYKLKALRRLNIGRFLPLLSVFRHLVVIR